MIQTELTEEQIEKREQEMNEFYSKRLPFLKLQHEYEIKNADLMEARVRIYRAKMALAELEMREAEAKQAFEKEQNASNKNREKGQA